MPTPSGAHPTPAPPHPRIDLDAPREASHWCDYFGVTIEQLTEAVRAVGHEPGAVREHLLRQGGSAGAG